MRSHSVTTRISLVVAATLLLALSATMAWAAANDFSARGRVPNGVVVAGRELGGMTSAEARDAILSAVAAPVLRPVDVVIGGQSHTFDPRDSVEIDVDAMLAAAFSARKEAPYLARVLHDVSGAPLPLEIEPRFTVDEARVRSWLTGVASGIDQKPRDAKVEIDGVSVMIKPARTGRTTDVETGLAAILAAFADEAALSGSDRVATVPVKIREPKVTETDLPKTIIVRLSERRVRLFDGEKLEKTYRCAIGTPSYPTPRGEFEIVQKRYMPTWRNPAPNGWGADMPRSIAPGPNNPLGTRALNLSAPAIRFHGTTNIGSIGTAASHGCMRMRRADIEDLYERVEVGTKVFIIP